MTVLSDLFKQKYGIVELIYDDQFTFQRSCVSGFQFTILQYAQRLSICQLWSSSNFSFDHRTFDNLQLSGTLAAGIESLTGLTFL